MRQVRIPASFDLDELAPVEVAEPSAPGPGEVLLRMEAVALNFRDLMVATGQDRWRPPPGRVPCSDGVGVVEQLGQGVTRFARGDRVMTSILPRWISGPLTDEKRAGGLGGPAADGVLSERIVLSAEGLVRAPERLDALQASTLPTAALTAWHALTRAEALRPGSTILTGGSGGVSLFAIQLAHAAGARVIATTSDDAKSSLLRRLGAAAVVNYRSRQDWAEDVLALTGGRGVDLAIDIGGAASLGESIRATAMGGTVSVVGLVGGLEATINLAELFQRNLRIDGIETGSRTMLEDLIEWIEHRHIQPVIDRTFTLDQTAAAFRHLQSGRHVGKVCIAI